MDSVQLDIFADDPQNRPWRLSAIGEGIQNACGVYTDNCLEFREGLIPHSYVSVKLCAVGEFIIYEFSYSFKDYGCGHPLCRPCHQIHRSNSAKFLATDIYNVFVNSVLPYDKNMNNYPEGKKDLSRKLRKVCDNIEKEVV